jgi:hypothetical protein
MVSPADIDWAWAGLVPPGAHAGRTAPASAGCTPANVPVEQMVRVERHSFRVLALSDSAAVQEISIVARKPPVVSLPEGSQTVYLTFEGLHESRTSATS